MDDKIIKAHYLQLMDIEEEELTTPITRTSRAWL
jgi:hypothetical protein